MVLLRVCRHFGHLRFASFLSMAAPQQSGKILLLPSPSHVWSPQPHSYSISSPSFARPPSSHSLFSLLFPAPLSGSAPKRLRAMATDAAAVPNPPASSGCPAMKAEFAKHAEYLNTLVLSLLELSFCPALCAQTQRLRLREISFQGLMRARCLEELGSV